MTKQQIDLVHWMYHWSVEHMYESHPDINNDDVRKLETLILERFPEEAQEIMRPYEG